jgi:2-keto-4-pentenoate hydratase/2-oxohepta-3-ene-1,7-dioic acid hydratase in catechol pathway
MKFVNFFHEGAVRTVCSAPLASSTSPPQIFGTVRHRWIDDIEALRSKINPANLPARSLDSLHLAPAVIAPEKITCVGLNYRRHALEAGFPVPTTPVIFGKFANSLAGSGTSVALPDVDTKYDFESELGVIIGRAARNVPVEAALDYVAGYCCANDLSARGAHWPRVSG